MTNPFRQHFQRTVAAKAARGTPAGVGGLRDDSAYTLMLAQLDEHRRALKAVESLERKADLKRQFLPTYDAWVAGVLEGATGAQDDVLMTIMVWRVDVGDFRGALEIGAYALRHGLPLPDQYKRSTPCLLVEEFAEAALRAHRAGEPIQVEPLLEIEQLTTGADMPDEVRAKLHKAIGYGLTAAEPARALDHLRRALQLFANVGVKKDIERLERELKNSASGGQRGPDG
ncbi:terminase [Burkholderia multivorans]|uniref:phage terminase small subunit n=1 Tax=Burkholderia multivorans TaxID=87883 RepID=UPI00057C3989|nr:terminase endonuclease subunit [Burkholderia multivorans]KHS11402.1 terminase [Burkholderia multivorans]KHS18442.1 terminase [Burkholderia multivorans]MBJ9623209.1 terminase endonuclease subunit [Burkholderia multivorans]MBJ9941335.1 terminase endonuclease subunit [Burkholderia multivorans]MBR7899679.1 terminase endonuclease subunit [Burkholderia multivorans]